MEEGERAGDVAGFQTIWSTGGCPSVRSADSGLPSLRIGAVVRQSPVLLCQ